MTTELELGVLVVVILKARNLNDKHSFYKQDAYAQASLNGNVQRTPVDVKGGQHPVWDAEVRFPVMKAAGEKQRILEVSCWAKEHKADDILGTGKVDITETLKTGEFDDWVPLMTNGASRGDIYLEMTFFAHGPAKPSLSVPAPANTTLNRRPSKLKPSERLWRPAPNTPPRTSPLSSPSHSPAPQVRSRQDVSPPPQSNQGKYLAPPVASPPSSRSSSASPPLQRRDSPLPMTPNEVPAALRPRVPDTLAPGGGAQRRSQSHTPPPPVPPPELPSILRPGRPTTPYNYSPPLPLPSENPADTSYFPNVAQPPFPRSGSAYSVPIPTYTPPEQRRVNDHSASLSFPVPQVPIALADGYGSSRYEAPTQSPYTYGGRALHLSDPYSEARYTTPLPLPESPPRGRPLANPDAEARKQVLLRAEEEAARRRRQEEEDLELARKLDLELNLGG